MAIVETKGEDFKVILRRKDVIRFPFSSSSYYEERILLTLPSAVSVGRLVADCFLVSAFWSTICKKYVQNAFDQKTHIRQTEILKITQQIQNRDSVSMREVKRSDIPCPMKTFSIAVLLETSVK